LLDEGQEVAFQIQVEKDAYVGVWTVDAEGAITQVFPNEYERNHRLRARGLRTVPSPDHMPKDQDYVIEAIPSARTEWVWVVASTEPWDELKGRQKGPFLVFENAQERPEGERQLRGLRVKLIARRGKVFVAEKVLPYRVSPRPGPCRN
jgi:hypothetical protein